MARYALLLIGCLLFGACAEIIPLSGGDADTTAPRVIPGKQQPEQGALGFNGSSIELQFDEFIKLNDPTNTISMNPNAGNIVTKVKNKSLSISWDGSLQPNTTYIVQLNGTVRDLNEGNDSIMQLVFSTGLTIDSLYMKGICSQAFSNAAAENTSIGLWNETSNPLVDKPVYATRTDKKGVFQFSYLKPGNYQLAGFGDANKNQTIDPNERFAFHSQLVNTNDTLSKELVLFQPKTNLNKLQVKIEAPGTAIIFGKNIDMEKLKINDLNVDLVKKYQSDSIRIALPSPWNESVRATFTDDTDTLIRAFTTKERNTSFSIQNTLGTKNWRVEDTLYFSVNELVSKIDTSRIRMIAANGKKIPYTFTVQRNQIAIIPSNFPENSFTLLFEKQALSGNTNASDSTRFNFKTYNNEDLSTLTLDCTELDGNCIIQLMDGEKIIATKTKLIGSKKVVFTRLVPGNYAVRCIYDTNSNGTWDTGNYETKLQPERVVRFVLKQKLRPNWEVEEILKIQPL